MLDSCVAAAPDDGADVPIQMDALQFIQKKNNLNMGMSSHLLPSTASASNEFKLTIICPNHMIIELWLIVLRFTASFLLDD